MAALPSGTVTFLFTDIEGSTRRWEAQPDLMREAVARHDSILRHIVERHEGVVFKMMGDACYASFHRPSDAVDAILAIHRALLSESWGELGAITIRAALHTGTPDERDGDYFGPPVNRVARILAAGHGGQTLLSAATQELVRDALPDGAELSDLGEHRLRDLIRGEHLFGLLAPDLPREFPALRTLDLKLTNLPIQPTSFVGREREIEAVVELLRTGSRLITLTGPGGTGKTRLGLQVGVDLLDDYLDGVYFVPLETVTDPAQLPEAIASVLGIKEEGATPILETLRSFLTDKRLLLLLDNLEQIEGVAPVLGSILSSGPHLQLLITSRFLLHVSGEQEYPVPPLALPDPRRLPPLEILSQYEAVRLFVQRAQATKMDFQVNNENAPAVAEICVRLDGLPLAIELAAARIKLLPPAALLTRLDNRLKFLTGGARDLPGRQQTLRGAIDWSYSLLSPEEQTLLARLSVFAGGCDFEGAEAICNEDGSLDVFEGISSLVDKSLLRQEGEGEPRFRMLETIREYAVEQLAMHGATEGIRQLHAVFYLRLAEEAEPKLRGPEQKVWLDRLETEHDNLRAALERLAPERHAEEGLRLASALCQFWSQHGHFREGQDWLERALTIDGVRSTATYATALNRSGNLAHALGDYARANTRYGECLALSRELEDTRGTAVSLNNLGIIAIEQGDYDRASPMLDESLTLFREIGERWGVANSLTNLGNIAWAQGDYERASAWYGETVAIFRELGSSWGMAHALNYLGNIAFARGDYQRATMLAGECLDLFRDLGDSRSVANTLNHLGNVAFIQGDRERATNLTVEGLVLARDIGSHAIAVGCMETLAGIASANHEPDRSTRLCAAAEIWRETNGVPRDSLYQKQHERVVEESREQLDKATWIAEWENGRAMSVEQAIVYALQNPAASGDR